MTMHRRPRVSGINSQMMEPDIIAPVLDNVAIGAVTGASPLALSAYKWLTSSEKTLDDARAYATRLAAAWKQLWELDVRPWASSESFSTESATTFEKTAGRVGADEGGILLGDVLPGGDPKATSEKQKKFALLDKISNDRRAFVLYAEKLNKIIGAPSPVEAWTELRAHEKVLHADRDKLEDYVSLQSEDPGDLENDKPASKFWPYAIGVGIVGGIAAALYALVRRRSYGYSDAQLWNARRDRRTDAQVLADARRARR